MEKNFNFEQDARVKIEMRAEKRGLSRGATIDDSVLEGIPVELVLINSIVRFEPEEKMGQPDSAIQVEEMVQKIKNGEEEPLPPISVMEVKGGYMILDGHHRYHAYELAKSQFVPVRVIPKEEVSVEIIDNLPQP